MSADTPVMFRLTGQVVNVYISPKGVNKSGEEYGGDDKVQVMGHVPLPNGQYKMELVDLKTDQGQVLKQAEGQMVTCPVAFFTTGKSVGYYVPKGHKIQLLAKQ